MASLLRMEWSISKACVKVKYQCMVNWSGIKGLTMGVYIHFEEMIETPIAGDFLGQVSAMSGRDWYWMPNQFRACSEGGSLLLGNLDTPGKSKHAEHRSNLSGCCWDDVL